MKLLLNRESYDVATLYAFGSILEGAAAGLILTVLFESMSDTARWTMILVCALVGIALAEPMRILLRRALRRHASESPTT
jgi:hypothetical protein